MRGGANLIDLAQWLARRWPSEPALVAAVASSGCAPLHRRGSGAVLGLIDAAIEPEVRDLVGASMQVRGFARRAASSRALRDHGTCSATLLVGQGTHALRGLVPDATLLVATVAEDDGEALPERVAEALVWLADAGATIIAVPMGSRERVPPLERAVASVVTRGVQVLAARGGASADAAWFPAGYPQVQAVAALPDGDLPVVGGDGLVSLRGGSSIACVARAGLAALRAVHAGRASGLDASARS